MRCQYCDKRLGITKRLKGDTFCSLEHQELYFNAQSNVLYDRLAAAAETPITAVQENQGTPEIAALAEAVERTAASELRLEPPVVDQSAPLLESYAAESKSGTVESHVTSAQEALAQKSWVLVVDVSPVEPAVEITPSAGETTWPSVPPGYPPIAVSSSSTLLLDPSGADFIPTLKGTPYPGEAPVWLFQTHAIETPPRPPVLPSGQPEARLNSEGSTLPAQAPQSTPLEVGWVPRLGSGYALTPLETLLASQGRMLCLDPIGERKTTGSRANSSLFGARFFAVAPGIAMPPAELPAAPVAHLPASLIPRLAPHYKRAQPAGDALVLPAAYKQLVSDSATPLRCDPPLAEIASPWQQTVITSQIPSVPFSLAPASMGLDVAAGTLPLECSIATTRPSTVPTSAAATSASSFLLLSNPLEISAPAMPVSSTAQLFPGEPCQPSDPLIEQQFAPSRAYLQPSTPSPSSLVTWSQSLSISNPACDPSGLSKPAQIALSARQGSMEALAPSSPSRRGQRLTPLKPPPNEVVWKPLGPIEANLRPPTIAPMSPGSEGTDPPTLVAVRIQPASMPVRPGAASTFRTQRAIGLAASGPFCEDALKLRFVDMAHGISKAASGLLSETDAALPSPSTAHRAFSLAMAPSSNLIEWGKCPPGPA